MRKLNKKITDQAVIFDILNTCHVGRLGTVGRDGRPVIKPLNFAYCEGRIYFHCALEGEKLDDISRDNRVCFETDLPVGFVGAAESKERLIEEATALNLPFIANRGRKGGSNVAAAVVNALLILAEDLAPPLTKGD